MKRTVEIDDTLDDRLDSAKSDLKDEATSFLDENPDRDGAPDLQNDLNFSGAFNGIVDSNTPIYNGEIRDLWYLYGSDFEAALDNAGIETSPDNRQQCAIYCYIEQELAEWYEGEKDAIYDDWREKNPLPDEDDEEEDEEDEEEDKPAE